MIICYIVLHTYCITYLHILAVQKNLHRLSLHTVHSTESQIDGKVNLEVECEFIYK